LPAGGGLGRIRASVSASSILGTATTSLAIAAIRAMARAGLAAAFGHCRQFRRVHWRLGRLGRLAHLIRARGACLFGKCASRRRILNYGRFTVLGIIFAAAAGHFNNRLFGHCRPLPIASARGPVVAASIAILLLLTPIIPLIAVASLLFGGLHQTVIMFRMLKVVFCCNAVTG
jgi:hypothetical protein